MSIKGLSPRADVVKIVAPNTARSDRDIPESIAVISRSAADQNSHPNGIMTRDGTPFEIAARLSGSRDIPRVLARKPRRNSGDIPERSGASRRVHSCYYLILQGSWHSLGT